jgi:acyl-CoA thioesterase-1
MKRIMIVAFIVSLGLLIEGVMLFRLARQVPAFATYWQGRAEKPIDAGALVYVALGDSAAQGVGASKPERGYVGLLADALEKNNQPVHVVNLSRSGAKIQDVLDEQLPRLKEITGSGNVVITLDVGANDLKSFDAHVFEARIKQLIDALPPQTVVADIPYFGPYAFGRGGKHVVAANEIIHHNVHRRGLRLANVYEQTRSHKAPHYYAADFFHPNDRAYRDWFDAFWNVIYTGGLL